MIEHADPGLEAAIKRLERGCYSASANDSTLIAMAIHRLTDDQFRRLLACPGEQSTIEQGSEKILHFVRPGAIAKDPCVCGGGEPCRCHADNE